VDNPSEPVPQETFIHLHLSWSSIIFYLIPPSVTIHDILSVQFSYLTVFFHNLSKFSLIYLLALHPPLHTPYVSSPIYCLIFAVPPLPITHLRLHAHTIATCFAVVPRLCHLILVSLNPSLGTQSCSLMPHIHLTIVISAH